MKKITIISHQSRIADFTVYPLRKNKKALLERGYDVRRCYDAPAKAAAADIICLSSVCIRKWWREPDRVFELLSFLRRRCNKLIYFDEFDSTGVTHFQLLPYVDLYLKKQLLRDRALYAGAFYGDRIFTDFYHREYGVRDDAEGHRSVPLDMSQAHKVGLLWHLGLGDMQGDILPSYLKRLLRCLPASYRVRWTPPAQVRPLDVMFRGKHSTYKNTVRFHRERMLEILSRLRGIKIATQDRVSIARYRREMRESKMVISPFGWGELGVRDFEAWMHGAALVKPDMSHMETWPDVFVADTTYYPVRWDFENLESGIRELLADDKRRLELARNGQEAYRHMLSGKGMEEFCSWFIRQIEG